MACVVMPVVFLSQYKVADIRGRVLSLSVWHTESLRANVFLGAVEAQLNHWDWEKSQASWHSLQPRVSVSFYSAMATPLNQQSH